MMSYIHSEKGVDLSTGHELVEGFLNSLDQTTAKGFLHSLDQSTAKGFLHSLDQTTAKEFLNSVDQTTRIDFDQDLALGWEQQTGCVQDPEPPGWTDQILETINPTLNFPCESFPRDPLINGTATSGAIYQTKSTSGPIYQNKSTKAPSGTIYQSKSTKCGEIYQHEDFPVLSGFGGGIGQPVDCSEARENLITGGFPMESDTDEDDFKLPSNFILSEEYLLKCLANFKTF